MRSTGATANGISQGSAYQNVATTTPRAASASSVERPWNENRPDSRIECPWPRSSIGASIAWFRPTSTSEHARPATANRKPVLETSPSAWRISFTVAHAAMEAIT
jgi:hypothetical protein